MRKHTDLINQIVVEGNSIPDMILWTNPSGGAQTKNRGFIKFGLCPGSADIIGIYKGRFVAIEAKTDNDRQKKAQKAFQKAVEKHGGIYIIARSVYDIYL